MNVSDSQRIAAKIESLGYKSAPEKDADLVIVNACSVRQKAVDRIWGGIKKWQAQNKQIIITGCVLSMDQKKLKSKGVLFFNINNLPGLKNVLTKPSNILQNIGVFSKEDLGYLKIKPKKEGKVTYIPIMTGCDNFCSYCAVPYTRGREISRPMKDIMADVKNALANGFKTILLLGQNVNSYGISRYRRDRCYSGKSDNLKFIKLLETVDNLVGDFKFNFISSNPHDMSDELIRTLATLKKWPRELHLPLQSGDDEILRKMNRKYNSKQFLDLVSDLKLKIPASPAGGKNLKLSTDIIVGFPGETKAQFNNTVKICKKIKFTKAYISQYSPRPGTTAAKLKDDVSQKVKKHRWLILNKLINH